MARIERVNYDTYIKPLEHIQKAHNDTLADMANMSQQSEILDYYLDPELDKESYNLYNNFKNEFNAQATDFAKNGYTRNNGARLLNLHRNYNRNVGNVLDAVKNREAERAEQHKLFADSNGQVVFGNGQNADEKSVDDYLRGNKGYVFQNLDEVYKYAKNQAAAASKREYKDGVRDAVRVLDNNYYKILEETGYDTQVAYEKLDAMMADVANQLDLTYNPNNDPNIDPKNDPAGLIRNMREELRRRGLENYSNEDKHKIISSFLTGTYEGLGYEPKLTLKETDQLKRAGAGTTVNKVYAGSGQAPTDNMDWNWDYVTVPSTYEISSKNQEGYIKSFSDPNNTTFAKKLFDGNKLMTFDEWYLKTKNVIKTKDGRYKSTTSGQYISDDGVKSAKNEYTKTRNHLKKTFNFTDSDMANMENGTINPLSIMIAKKNKNDENLLPHEVIATNMKFNDSDLKNIITRALTRYNGRKPLTQLGYNADSRIFSFNDDGDDIKDEVQESKTMGGAIIRMMYLPQSKKDQDPLWAQITILDVNNGEPFYIPLSALSSYSAAKKATTLNDWAVEQQSIVNRNKEIIGADAEKYGFDVNNLSSEDIPNFVKKVKEDKNTTKEYKKALLDCLAQIDEALGYIDYYKKQGYRTAEDNAHRDTKEKQDDKNAPVVRKQYETSQVQ